MKEIIEQINENKVKCKHCKDIIESLSVNDYKRCSCGKIEISGGHDYLKRIGNKDNYEELSNIRSLVKITTDGFEVIENALSRKDIDYDNIHCPFCNDSNISLEKGNGELIIGDDIIALICHECRKIYKFSDVKYRV